LAVDRNGASGSPAYARRSHTYALGAELRTPKRIAFTDAEGTDERLARSARPGVGDAE
jgi:hypothetical protein